MGNFDLQTSSNHKDCKWQPCPKGCQREHPRCGRMNNASTFGAKETCEMRNVASGL